MGELALFSDVNDECSVLHRAVGVQSSQANGELIGAGEARVRRIEDNVSLNGFSAAQESGAVLRKFCGNGAMFNIDFAMGRLFDNAGVGEARKGAVLLHQRSACNFCFLAGGDPA